MAVHLGKKVKQVFQAARPKVTVTAFASEIGRSRKSVYELFEQPNIDLALLRKIGKVLQHDFMQYLTKPVEAPMVMEEQAGYGKASIRTSDVPPLQITVNIDPNDPRAQEKLARIMSILREE